MFSDFYENWLVYGFFSGFRSATPFLHSLGTGIVAIGLYYYVTREGNWGIKLLSTYVSAVAIHSIWNTLGLSDSPLAGGTIAISVTFVVLGSTFYSLRSYLTKD